jgi:hypothetical protein
MINVSPMDSSKSNDKRHDTRISIAFPTRWDGLSGHHTAHVTDISLSGCYIDTLANMPARGLVCFEVQLPNQQWLELKGFVVNTFPGMGYGIHFSSLSHEAITIIKRLISE